MSKGIRRPHEVVDYDQLTHSFPPPPEYFDSTYLESRDEIERKQLSRLKDRALRAYQVPFFKRRWDEAGFDPNSIESLDDLSRGRHPKEHRSQPAIRRLSGRAPQRRRSGTHAGFYVRRDDRHITPDALYSLGPRSRCHPDSAGALPTRHSTRRYGLKRLGLLHA